MMIDVVLTGNIRSEIAFFQVLTEIVSARSDGFVDQIVFVTWESERAKFLGLFENLNRFSIDVVTVERPAEFVDTIVVQQLQFWRGLQSLRRLDGWVLRARTDKAAIHTAAMLDYVRGRRHLSGALVTTTGTLERKVVVPGVSINEVLVQIDLVMLMLKSDARRLANFDLSFAYMFSDDGGFAVDSRWFLGPSLSSNPGLKLFLERVNSPRLANAIQIAARDGSVSTAPDDLFRFLGALWAYTDDLFAVTDNGDHGSFPELADVLAGRAVRPVALILGESVAATNQPWLTHLAHADPGQDTLLQRVADKRVSPADFGAALMDLDFAALNSFVADKAGPPTPRNNVVRYPARHADRGLEDVFRSLIRAELDTETLSAAYSVTLEAIHTERVNGGSSVAFATAASVLDREARAAGDRAKAQVAFALYLSAAGARVPEAVDGACGLAFDGFVDPDQVKDAFSTVYTVWSIDPTWPPGLFWYGLIHLNTWLSDQTNVDHGYKLIREAAERGFGRAVRFLEASMEKGVELVHGV